MANYESLGRALGQFIEVKNRVYGAASAKGGAMLKVIYPDGIAVEQLDDVVFLSRAIDKLFRIATEKQALGEKAYADLLGYCLLRLTDKDLDLTGESMDTNNNDKLSFENLGAEVGRICQEKNEAYGDSYGKGGEVLKILFPNGVKPEQYDDMLALARIIDKLFRLANKRDAYGESPMKDIAGYALLGLQRDEKAKQKKLTTQQQMRQDFIDYDLSQKQS